MSGIFSFIKNLFNGIFAFLGGLLGQKQTPALADGEAAPKVKKNRNSGYFLELDEARSVPTPEPAKAKKPEPAAPAAVGPTTVAAATPAPAAAPTPVLTPAPVETSKPAANPLNLPQPTVTFAPTYLNQTSSRNGRRRPGANMTYFLDMARKVKTSNS